LNNKPKYSLFKNTKYALDGLLHALKTESSFRLELICAIFIISMIIYLDISFVNKLRNADDDDTISLIVDEAPL
jgi:diacylglycerol kinase (ATP)